MQYDKVTINNTLKIADTKILTKFLSAESGSLLLKCNYTTDLSQRREHERESICSQINNC